MTLRLLRDDDLPALMALWNAVKRDAYPYLPLEQGRTIEEDMGFFQGFVLPRCAVWVAEEQGKLLGFMAIEESGYIDRLYIAVDAQRRGVGTRLMDHAKSLRPDGLTLHTHVQNESARAFYEKHGFQAIEFGISAPPESMPDVKYAWKP